MKEFKMAPQVIDVGELHSLTLKEIKKSTRQVEGSFVSTFKNLTLMSYFQPIYSIDHQKIIGYEALIRAKDKNEEGITPDALFDIPLDEKNSIYLDRLCRCTHLANYQKLKCQDKWLFINVSSLACEKSRDYGKFFSDLLHYFNVPAEKVVVEIIEDYSSDNTKLMETCNYYKSIGCLVAIDDFGSGHSNFERIWNLQPDIVKLDRSIIARAAQSTHTQNMLKNMVQLLHQSCCLVVIEGIENEQEAIIAIASNADFVQGFYFSRPHHASFKHVDPKPLFNRLINKNIAEAQYQLSLSLKWESIYRPPFLKAVIALKLGGKLSVASKPLMNVEKVNRSFLLDNQGKQLGESYTYSHQKLSPNEQFHQLQLGNEANWHRKHYVRNALRTPNNICISVPYQSITGEGLCITMSMSFDTNEGQRILCIDISAA